MIPATISIVIQFEPKSQFLPHSLSLSLCLAATPPSSPVAALLKRLIGIQLLLLILLLKLCATSTNAIPSLLAALFKRLI